MKHTKKKRKYKRRRGEKKEGQKGGENWSLISNLAHGVPTVGELMLASFPAIKLDISRNNPWYSYILYFSTFSSYLFLKVGWGEIRWCKILLESYGQSYVSLLFHFILQSPFHNANIFAIWNRIGGTLGSFLHFSTNFCWWWIMVFLKLEI